MRWFIWKGYPAGEPPAGPSSVGQIPNVDRSKPALATGFNLWTDSTESKIILLVHRVIYNTCTIKHYRN